MTHPKKQNKATGFVRSSRIPLLVRDLFTQSAGGILNICNCAKQSQFSLFSIQKQALLKKQTQSNQPQPFILNEVKDLSVQNKPNSPRFQPKNEGCQNNKPNYPVNPVNPVKKPFLQNKAN